MNESTSPNKFIEFDSLEGLLYGLAGAATTCWDENGVLQDEFLVLFCEDARARLLQLLGLTESEAHRRVGIQLAREGKTISSVGAHE